MGRLWHQLVTALTMADDPWPSIACQLLCSIHKMPDLRPMLRMFSCFAFEATCSSGCSNRYAYSAKIVRNGPAVSPARSHQSCMALCSQIEKRVPDLGCKLGLLSIETFQE